MKRSTLTKAVALLVVFAGVVGLRPTAAEASHFRYGNISWQKTAKAKEVRFKLTCAFVRSAEGNPNLGAIISDTVGGTSLDFGDGTSSGLSFRVTALNAAPNRDYIICEALDPTTQKEGILHTYAADGPFSAGINSSARIGPGLLNNRFGGSYQVRTLVNLSVVNNSSVNGNGVNEAVAGSPVIGLVPIVNVAENAAASFLVPAVDPAGKRLRFRLSTDAEAGGGPSPGFGTTDTTHRIAVDASTGRVTWNTLGLDKTKKWTAQVIVESLSSDGTTIRSQAAVDFLLQIVTQVGTPPSITIQPSTASTVGACGSAPSFTVRATDPDARAVIELNSGGLPNGSTMTPQLPKSGPSGVSSIFTWNTQADQVGVYVLFFSAEDENGLQAYAYTVVTVIPRDYSNGPTSGPVLEATFSGLPYRDQFGRSTTSLPYVEVAATASTRTVATDANGNAIDKNGELVIGGCGDYQLISTPVAIRDGFLTIRRQRDGAYWTGGNWTLSAAPIRLPMAANRDHTLFSRSQADGLPNGADVSEGFYEFRFIATFVDDAGNTGDFGSQDLLAYVDLPPTVTFTRPASASVTDLASPITGTVQHTRILSVQLFIRRDSDGLFWTGSGWGAPTVLPTVLNPPNSSSATWSYSAGPNSAQMFRGSYTLTATAFDTTNKQNTAFLNVTDTDSPTTSAWRVADIATGRSDKTRMLWLAADGRFELWRVDGTGTKEATGLVYGPFAGWTARAIAVGGDGQTRVLWNHSDGQMMLRTYSDSGVETSYRIFAARSGWTARDLAVSADNKIFLLWTQGSGQMQVERLSSTYATEAIGPVHGPFSGWSFSAISIGGDGFPRLLVNNVNGQQSFWQVSANGDFLNSSPAYGPYAGWTTKDIAVEPSVNANSNSNTRLLWNRNDGALSLWLVDPAYQFTNGPGHGPFTGWSADAISIGNDNLTRVLWNNTDGSASMWRANPDGTRRDYSVYPPHP